MIRNGKFVADHLSGTKADRIEFENIQPNGVDLRVGEIKRLVGNSAYFGLDDYQKPKRMSIRSKFMQDREVYRLYSGRYIVIYDEEIEIPEGHVGRVYPRSRVMRSGCHLTSALWDQGYEGRGEGLLQVPPCLDYVDVEPGSSLAQMIFEKADGVDDAYDGSHQGERL